MAPEMEVMMADGQPNEDPVCPNCDVLLDICDYIDHGQGIGVCPPCSYEESVDLQYG